MKKILKTLCALSIVVVLAACNEEAGSGAPAPAAKTNFAVSLPGRPVNLRRRRPAGRRSDRTLLQRRDGLPGGCRRQYGGACLERRRDQFETETVRTDCRTFEGARIREHGSVSLPTGAVSYTTLRTAYLSVAISGQNQAVKTLADEDAKGNAAGDYLSVQQVTLVGEQTSFTTETSDDGHTLKKPPWNSVRWVSRFDVGTVKAGTGLDALTVEAVYVNNFTTNSA